MACENNQLWRDMQSCQDKLSSMTIQEAFRGLGIYHNVVRVCELQGYIKAQLDAEDAEVAQCGQFASVLGLVQRLSRDWSDLEVWNTAPEMWTLIAIQLCVNAVRDGGSLLPYISGKAQAQVAQLNTANMAASRRRIRRGSHQPATVANNTPLGINYDGEDLVAVSDENAHNVDEDNDALALIQVSDNEVPARPRSFPAAAPAASTRPWTPHHHEVYSRTENSRPSRCKEVRFKEPSINIDLDTLAGSPNLLNGQDNRHTEVGFYDERAAIGKMMSATVVNMPPLNRANSTAVRELSRSGTRNSHHGNLFRNIFSLGGSREARR